MKKTLKDKRAITLIALVITIVVLVILASVIISMTIGKNGLIERTLKAQDDTYNAKIMEEFKIIIASVQAEKKGEATLQDIIDYLKIDSQNEYIVSLSKIANINGEMPKLDDVSEVFVIYKDCQFRIDEDLNITCEGKMNKSQVENSNYIIYDANGGQNPPENQNRKNKIISSTIPKRDNYIFLGWGKSAESTEVAYKPGDEYKGSSVLYLYAVWRPEIKTVVKSSLTNLNTSAKVSAISGKNVTINNSTLLTSSVTGEFKTGDKVMLYVSNSNSASSAGKFEIFNITGVNSNVLTLNNNINTSIFTNSNCQIVKVLTGDTVIVNANVTVTASAYNGNCGGIIAIDADKITLNGKLNASKCGYDSSNTAPNNGGHQSSGNQSHAGGSNRYKGGNGGKNYQGYTGTASNAVGISADILTNKQMTFGGGSNGTKGGGLIYINSKRLEIGSQYPISANGQGGAATPSGASLSGGGAGGSICINSKEIVFTTSNKNHFVGACGGSGATENRNSSSSYPKVAGNDGTNVVGGTAPNSNSGKKGGTGNSSNGGGGAQYGNAGGNATTTNGGAGAAGHKSLGYNAGGGGGGRRIYNHIYRHKPFLNSTNKCTNL